MPLDMEELADHIAGEYPGKLFAPIRFVRPSEIFFDPRWLVDVGVRPEEIAAGLGGYRYGENVAHVPAGVVLRDRLDRPLFAGLFADAFLEQISLASLPSYGETTYPEADPGVASVGD